MRLGARLRELRESQRKTLKEVADRANLSVPQLSKIELGDRGLDVEVFVEIAKALGHQPGDLLPNSAGLYPEFRPLLTRLSGVPETSRPLVIGALAAVLDVREDAVVHATPQPRADDNVLQFVPAKAPSIPTSNAQIDSLGKAMGKLGAEPRRARHGEDYAVPLVANLSAGRGLETFTREHEYRDINTYYWNRGVRAVFRVVGNSMFDMGITDRDLVYVRPLEHSAPKNGDVVACTLNNESYVKVYEKDENGVVWLKSKAEGYAPIEVKADDDLRIWGVVLGRTGDL